MKNTILILTVLTLTGCTTLTGGTVELTVTHDAEPDPEWFKVALRNTLDGTITVSYTGFRIVDANGTATQPYREGMTSLQELGFPRTAQLAPNEQARGILTFYSPDEIARPIDLKYDYGGVTATLEDFIPAQE